MQRFRRSGVSNSSHALEVKEGTVSPGAPVPSINPYCSIAVGELRDGGHTLRVSGELDAWSVVTLADLVRDLSVTTRAVQIDLGDVSFIDAAALRALSEVHRTAGAQIMVSAVSPAVRRVIDLAPIAGPFVHPLPVAGSGHLAS